MPNGVWDCLIASDITRQGGEGRAGGWRGGDKLRYSNSQFDHCIHKLKAVCDLQKTFISCNDRAGIVTNGIQNLILHWLNYNPGWASSLIGVCCYTEDSDCERTRSRKLKWRYVGRPWWSWGHWTPRFWWVFFAREAASSPHLRGLGMHCLSARTESSRLPGSQACQPGDCNYTVSSSDATLQETYHSLWLCEPMPHNSECLPWEKSKRSITKRPSKDLEQVKKQSARKGKSGFLNEWR